MSLEQLVLHLLRSAVAHFRTDVAQWSRAVQVTILSAYQVCRSHAEAICSISLLRNRTLGLYVPL